MGNSQSSRASTKTKAPATNRSSESARGRKSTPGDADTATTQGLSNVEVHHTLVSTSDDADTESDYEGEESDEGMLSWLFFGVLLVTFNLVT